jgi:3-oxoacyl-[acyl-carrier protein] reductase
MEGKVAIVTGGGSGIGRALSIGLARTGAAVTVCDNRLPAATSTVAEIQKAGGRAAAIEADVSQARSVEEMVRKTVEASGRVDILVNCAGIYPRSPVMEMSEEDWRRVLDVNLTGAFLCCKAVAKHMVPQRSGKIVNLVSGRGVTGDARGAHYAASKGGLIAFTVSLGIELGPHGINVNGLAPGVTDTPMARAGGFRQAPDTPFNKSLGQPEDIVGPVLFLVSDASRTMCGQILFMKTP